MAHFHLSMSDGDEGESISLSFRADQIQDVLERLQAFLRSGGFPYVTELVAVSHDEGGNEDEDVYWYADGTRLTGRDIDALNKE